MKIPFNKPYLSGNETNYIRDAVLSGKISGDGDFTRKCHAFFSEKFGFHKVLLTNSCTDAIEMAALLAHIQPGDEVIAPAYTFVSTVNAFVLRGAQIVFADSRPDHPNMDTRGLEALISPKTKAIVVVHYAGIACDMDPVMDLARKHHLIVVEDSAQAIDSYYKGKPLGAIGDFGTFSFHETKNVISGEGGMLVINNPSFERRAEIIWEKGTNRSAFFRGEVNKYEWMDIGSSYLPSEIIAAFLYAQLENLNAIQEKRKRIWRKYYEGLVFLAETGRLRLPFLPSYASNNGHMFYLVCASLAERTALIQKLRIAGVHAIFHYLALHLSPFYTAQRKAPRLPYAENFTDCLIRLPLFFELTDMEVFYIIDQVIEFYREW